MEQKQIEKYAAHTPGRRARVAVQLRQAVVDELRAQASKNGHSLSRIIGEVLADGMKRQKRAARKVAE